jgi:hypothetical protein
MVTKRSLAALLTVATFLVCSAGAPGGCCWTLLCHLSMESGPHEENSPCQEMPKHAAHVFSLGHGGGHHCQCSPWFSLRDAIPTVIGPSDTLQVAGTYDLLNVVHDMLGGADSIPTDRVIAFTMSGSNVSIRNCSLLS